MSRKPKHSSGTRQAGVLIDDTTRKAITLPATLTDFRGERVRVVGIEVPRHSGSTGRILTSKGDRFYPGVVNATILVRWGINFSGAPIESFPYLCCMPLQRGPAMLQGATLDADDAATMMIEADNGRRIIDLVRCAACDGTEICGIYITPKPIR